MIAIAEAEAEIRAAVRRMGDTWRDPVRGLTLQARLQRRLHTHLGGVPSRLRGDIATLLRAVETEATENPSGWLAHHLEHDEAHA